MRNFVLIPAFIFAAAAICHGQELYMPRNVEQAYLNGTRSLDGRPGKNYWQNRARYKINMTMTPPNRLVKGSETIVYYNNSPDSLRMVFFKLFLNIHKPGAPRNGGASEDYLTSGVHITQFAINGEPARWPGSDRTFTVQRIRLNTPLPPKDSIEFTIDWNFEISLESGREGMIDSSSWFLAYFYPRIAVLDDYNGWDTMNFMDSHEFYSDFNDYDVTINVPEGYIVWGTGTLQDPEHLLQPKYLERYERSLTSDEVINIVTAEDLKAGNITKNSDVNSWRFTANNIPDMAFGLSDHYNWDGTSVVVEEAIMRRASAQAAYMDSAWDYHHVAKFARHALDWLSDNWPGVPYPYEKTTVFQGFAGMEYPMMANDEAYPDTVFSKFVAQHEIAHTYMPFYMGTNETRYGFMDEGWATTFELLIGREVLGKERAELIFKRFRVSWTYSNSSDLQIPIVTPGDALTGFGFGTNEYGKAALGYLAVKDILGDDLFKRCLQAYMERWNGKHPNPWDFFFTFNDVSGENLNWFWNNWFFSHNYMDVAVSDVVRNKKNSVINIKNIGGFFIPLDITINYEDGSSETFHKTPRVWQGNEKELQITIDSKQTIKSVTVDGGIWVDGNPGNNRWELK